MKYSVGQVLYAVFKKDNKVIPVLVVEEITKRTKDGVRIDYTVQVGPNSSSKDSTINLSSIEGEIFSSTAEAVDTLTSRAKTAIAKLVENARQKASVWYEAETKESRENFLSQEPNSSIDDVAPAFEEDQPVMITLPDGTRAKVAMPPRVA